MLISVPLGSMVSDKRKNKVRANEYVNFLLLLSTQVTNDSYSIKMPALMKHRAVVRDLTKNFANWKFYHANFRVL